jgi:hypothetical protein
MKYYKLFWEHVIECVGCGETLEEAQADAERRMLESYPLGLCEYSASGEEISVEEGKEALEDN